MSVGNSFNHPHHRHMMMNNDCHTVWQQQTYWFHHQLHSKMVPVSYCNNR